MNRKVLPRKAQLKSQDERDKFLAVFNNPQEFVSKDHIDRRIEETANEMIRIVHDKNVAIAWSGGKDSITLKYITDIVGIKKSMIGLTNLEYSFFLDWLNSNSPMDISIINTGQDLEWLSNHPEMLFPDNSKYGSIWYRQVQQRAQDIYFKEYELDIILLGRRTADNNYVGTGGSNIYTNAKGITRYSPISDWSHEEVLALIHYYNLELPPFYNLKRPFYLGTHPWARRKRHSQDIKDNTFKHTWAEIYEFEPKTVEFASTLITTAKQFLDEVG